MEHQSRGRLLFPDCHVGGVQAVETGLAWCQRITGSTELPALLRVADSALVQYMAQLQVWLLAEVKHCGVSVKRCFMHQPVDYSGPPDKAAFKMPHAAWFTLLSVSASLPMWLQV